VWGWILNLAYAALLATLSPVLVYRALFKGKYRTGWREKLLGHAPRRESTGECAWLHAVSVGEVLLLRTIIDQLQAQQPHLEIWISTTTHTGHAIAREKYPDCRTFYYPLDFTWAVRNALHRVRPTIIGLAELELWPNFIRAAAATGVPLILMNGRLSDRSFRGYSRIRFLIRSVITCFTRIGAQNDVYRERFIALGASPDAVITTGSVKFDGVAAERNPTRTAALRIELGIAPHQRILVAGSTHAPEEAIVLATYRELLRSHADLRLIIAPRHQERFGEVATLIEDAGFPVLRRTARDAAANPDQAAVVLLDTLGELSTIWSLADVAFVGGSLCQRGGQNMLEPCAYGAATVCGPNTWHFRQIVEWLTSQQGLAVVADQHELTSTIARLLDDPAAARRQGLRARAAVLSQQGATTRTVELLLDALQSPSRGVLNKAA
jgi:3-deoxy-D-manno-octulosonic-acid transferase